MRIRIPRFFRADAGRKLVAFAFAFLLWFYVRGQLQETTTLGGIPVTLEYDSDSVYLEQPMVTATATLRGSKQRLQRLQADDVGIRVRIPAAAVAGAGFHRLTVRPEDVGLPRGVRLAADAVKLSPEMVAVDRVETRRNVPIRVQFTGSLSEEFARNLTVVPAQVTLRGPGGAVRGIQEMVTEPVRLDASMVSAFEATVKLVQIPRVAADVREAHVTVDVFRRTVLRTYENLPLFVLALPGGDLAVAEPLPGVSVSLRGHAKVLEGLDSFALLPFIDLADVKAPGRYQRPVRLWHGVPQGVMVEALSPGLVEVAVVRRGEGPPATGGRP
ncbi:MAG: CdaR family protein [Lentisphaeria bacterium]|jgi:hypothetical protein